MPFDQNQLPTWNKEGVEPPQSLKDDGWQPSQKPPADYFNWFFNKTFKALQSLFTNAQHKEEKGQPGGYAALDENGKVINADGTYPGGVQSVNGKTGNVNLTASDVGAETPNGAQAKADQAEANAKAYTDNQIIVNTNKTYVSSTAPTGTKKVGDMWFNPTSSTFSIWNGTTWAELSVNNPKGTVNFVTNDARLVIPVGTDKYATS
jgi:hypothetical protein